MCGLWRRMLLEGDSSPLDGPHTFLYEFGPMTQLVEASRELPLVRWHQYLKFTEYEGSIYFDEGNGENSPK